MSSSTASSLARGADIIDLDRYMRCSVRPSNPRHTRDRLVVDAGGVGSVGVVGAVGAGVGSDSDSARSARRDKRYWHDSGLSDGSGAKPRRRSHRQASEGGTGSVRAFRAACERALRDQQLQLARVTQLCELLLHTPGGETNTQPSHGETRAQPPHGETRAQPSNHSAQVSKKNFGQNVSPRSVPRRRRASSRSSDGSSCSSRRAHRSESCRTYDIIVSKLDELSRLFAARRAAVPAAAPAAIISTAAPQVTLDATEEPASALQPHASTPHTGEQRASEQRAGEQRVGEQRTSEQRAGEQRVGEQRTSEQRAGEQRTGEQRTSEQRTSEQRTGEQREGEQRTGEQRTSEQRTGEQHTGEQRAGEQFTGEQFASEQRAGEHHGVSLCALCRGSWRRLTRRLFGAAPDIRPCS